MASPSRTGAGSPAVRRGRRISHPSSPLVTELRKLCWGVRRAVLGRAQRALCELGRFPHTFFLLLGGRCCSPQADGCSAATSLPRRILSRLLLPEPAVPRRLSPPPPLSGTAHPLPAAFPSSFSTSRLQLPPPSADRGARSRTAPFSPRERKKPGAHLRRGSAPAALWRPRGGERSAAAAGERRTHRQMPRDGCRLADAAARHGSFKGLKRT